MVKWADVLVESSKGGTWEVGPYRRGAVGERAVILHISGFVLGDRTTCAASFDPIGQAFSGYSNLNASRQPARDEAFSSDFMTNLMGAGHACRCHPRARDRRRVHRLLPIRGARASAGATLSDINHGIQPCASATGLVGVRRRASARTATARWLAVGGAGGEEARRVLRVRRRSRLPAAGTYPPSRASPAARAWTSRCRPRCEFRAALDGAGARSTVERSTASSARWAWR